MDVEASDEQVPSQDVPENVTNGVDHVEDPARTPDGVPDEQPPVTPPEVMEPNGVVPEDAEMDDIKPQRSPSESPLLDATPHYRTKYIMSGHARSISAIKFSPDGTMLASCGEYHL